MDCAELQRELRAAQAQVTALEGSLAAAQAGLAEAQAAAQQQSQEVLGQRDAAHQEIAGQLQASQEAARGLQQELTQAQVGACRAARCTLAICALATACPQQALHGLRQEPAQAQMEAGKADQHCLARLTVPASLVRRQCCACCWRFPRHRWNLTRLTSLAWHACPYQLQVSCARRQYKTLAEAAAGSQVLSWSGCCCLPGST